MKCYTFESRHFSEIQRNIQNILDNGGKVDNLSLSTTKVGYETYYSAIVIVE